MDVIWRRASWSRSGVEPSWCHFSTKSASLHQSLSTVSNECMSTLRRRTETVVEKLLTNWLALCMYDYIESRAGSSLFLLYKAIKCQIEKGPVDQFTQESKYALSDEGLLRESCDYSVVTCLVVQRELEEAYQVSTVNVSMTQGGRLISVYKRGWLLEIGFNCVLMTFKCASHRTEFVIRICIK